MPATVHWTDDEWQTVHDDPTKDTGLGIHHLDLDLHELPGGSVVTFTLFWEQSKKWEGLDYRVEIEA
jgi:glucoamylase